MTLPQLPNKRFTSRLMRVSFHLLPSRMKRLMFLSSLYGQVSKEKEINQERLVRFKEAFDLCRDPRAIALPMACSDRIWNKRTIDELVCKDNLCSRDTEKDITRIARMIVVGMPCWLVYDHTTKIVQDVKKLLTHREDLFAI